MNDHEMVDFFLRAFELWVCSYGVDRPLGSPVLRFDRIDCQLALDELPPGLFERFLDVKLEMAADEDRPLVLAAREHYLS